MSINVDARGLACPQPLIATKKALESITEGIVITMVDNAAAKENVVKFAVANDCDVQVTEQGGCYSINITKGQPSSNAAAPIDNNEGDNVYLITQDTLGHGSSELGAVLMKSFMYTLLETKPLPKAVLFINAGVKLTTTDSPVLEHLKVLAASGVEILSCGTCLDYYELKEKLAVGSITNMYTIVEKISGSKTITL